MTTEEALDFLRANQPMPPTRVVADSVISKFDQVRQHFETHRDDRCVPLLLNALGEGEGHGTYQMVEGTILKYSESVVLPALIEGLQSPLAATRSWNAEISSNYRRPELIPHLQRMLQNGDEDERLSAVTALWLIGLPSASTVLRNALATEVDRHVRGHIESCLSQPRGAPGATL